MITVLVLYKLNDTVFGCKPVFVGLITSLICKGNVVSIVIFVHFVTIIHYHHSFIEICILCMPEKT